MGSFGERLRREREMRGIGLEEIAEATKIGTRSLRALEEQDFDKLPGGIFNKGFVRAYSKYLGIDEEQAVADYVSAVDEAQATGKLTRTEIGPPSAEAEERREREPVRIPWAPVVWLVLLVALFFVGKHYYAKREWVKLWRRPVATDSAAKARSSASAAGTAGPTQSGAATAPPSGTPAPKMEAQAIGGSATPELPPKDGFIVRVHANELSWVDIRADGKLVTSEILPANADRLVHASKEIVIKTGNAGGIELVQNNKLLPPIGPKHEVRTVTVTAQGIASEQ